jgi:beta-glucosidase
MNKRLNKTYKILVTTFGTLFGLAYLGTTIAMENRGVINNKLGVSTTLYIAGDTTDVDTNYFPSKYSKLEDVMTAGRQVCEEAEEEGAVLLKNENNALPLTSGNRKVSLVGITSVDPVYGGTGSGAVKTDDAETVKDAMESAGFTVNADLWNWYTSNKATYARATKRIGAGYFAPNEMLTNDAPWDVVNGAVGTSFANYGDAAVVMLGRVGGEGGDMPTSKANTVSKTSCNAAGDYLALSDVEKTLFKGLADLKKAGTIKKIVVLINSANAMEVPFLDDATYSVDAAMWIGSTGHKGLSGAAKLMAGDNGITPSGKLSDTYYTDNAYNPIMANFGDYNFEDFDKYFQANQKGSYGKSLVYQEGIYLGYRYTETRYEDKVLGNTKAGDFDYSKVVDYPFGYGLSYTDFGFTDMKVTSDGDNYKVSVKVTNNGKTYSGKEVVQIYAQKPYTDYDKANGIEKSAVDLVGFAKTEVLAPGASSTVSVDVDGRDFASYDANKAKTYILDAGTYYLTAAENAHDAVNNILAAKGKKVTDGMTEEGNSSLTWSTKLAFSDTKYSYSEETNKKITNLFDHADINKYDGTGNNKVNYMSRNDWTGTYPADDGVKLYMTQKLHDDMVNVLTIPSDDIKYPTYGQDNKMQLIDLKQDDKNNDIPYDAKEWDTLLDQLSWDDTVKLVANGMRSTIGIDSVGKIATRDHNGPTGCTEPYGAGTNGLAYKTGADTEQKKYPTCYPCNGIIASTFNTELSAKVGDAIGEDALWAGYSGLYGPCSNIHRSPYEGRCFEYYSEDAELSGLILGAETEKIQSHGCYVYNKHFAMNDQETNRSGVSTWANEQTIRENYLKAFELTIKKGNAKNVMTAFNRLGAIPCFSNYNLLTSYLHEECGMEGFAVTDYFAADYTNLEAVLMAGGDLPDGNLKDEQIKAFSDSYATGHGQLANNMREAAHRILYTVVHSNAMNGIAPGGKIVTITPAWQTTLKVVDWTLGAFFVISGVMCGLNIANVFPKTKKEA